MAGTLTRPDGVGPGGGDVHGCGLRGAILIAALQQLQHLVGRLSLSTTRPGRSQRVVLVVLLVLAVVLLLLFFYEL